MYSITFSLLECNVDSPDYVHGLVNDLRLVNSNDLPGSRFGGEHGEDSRTTSHVKHHLRVKGALRNLSALCQLVCAILSVQMCNNGTRGIYHADRV